MQSEHMDEMSELQKRLQDLSEKENQLESERKQNLLLAKENAELEEQKDHVISQLSRLELKLIEAQKVMMEKQNSKLASAAKRYHFALISYSE